MFVVSLHSTRGRHSISGSHLGRERTFPGGHPRVPWEVQGCQSDDVLASTWPPAPPALSPIPAVAWSRESLLEWNSLLAAPGLGFASQPGVLFCFALIEFFKVKYNICTEKYVDLKCNEFFLNKRSIYSPQMSP